MYLPRVLSCTLYILVSFDRTNKFSFYYLFFLIVIFLSVSLTANRIGRFTSSFGYRYITNISHVLHSRGGSRGVTRVTMQPISCY